MTTYHDRGPISYINWKAYQDGQPLNGISEYPLFTDSNITGEIVKGYGPYQLLNTLAINKPNIIAPAIVLRVADHVPEDHFKREIKTDASHYHGGWLSDEIAALLSLNLSLRVKAGGCRRRFDSDKDEKGLPTYFSLNEDPVYSQSPMGTILPCLRGDRSLNNAFLLERLPILNSESAKTLVKAARLYQDAIWLSESEPALAWLLLVSSTETAAVYWKNTEDSPVERLKEFNPKLIDILEKSGGPGLIESVAKEISDLTGATKKFVDFIINFLPPPPVNRPPLFAQHPWDIVSLRKSLNIIYRCRSRALHGGVSFPAPMCLPTRKQENGYWEKPGGLATHTKGATWVAEDTPMLLHTFEYIVRNALLKWWESLLPNRY